MSSLRVGSLVYCTHQGLGILAKSFYDNGIVTDPIIVRHGRHHNNLEWYPEGTPVIADIRRDVMRVVDPVLAQVDVMFFFETPFDWQIIDRCRKVGVKTLLMPMYECMPRRLPLHPDAIVNPSMLDQQYYPQGTFIPVPVEMPWTKRTTCETFVFSAGHGGLKGRNGTAEVVEALKYIKAPAKLLLRTQGTRLDVPYKPDGTNVLVEQRIGTVSPEEVYREGQCFLFPEKFNGLSLPLQEARASGMLIMCGDRFPMNTWLPNAIPGRDFKEERGNPLVPIPGTEKIETFNPLIPVKGYRKNQIGPPYNVFDEAIFDPRDIAAKIDEWYGRDISDYSESGREWAALNSWTALKPRYVELLQRLVGQ